MVAPPPMTTPVAATHAGMPADWPVPGGVDAVIALARRAAEAIRAVYQGEFAVRHKDDASPLTAADMASHRVLMAGLAALTPGIPVLSEESAADVGAATRHAWARLWVVDPLDGTREFVKRNDEFCINIALVEDGVAVCGLIHAPVTGTTWHAAHGTGAFRRDGAGERAIHTRRPATAPLRVAASRSHRDAATDALIARMGEVAPMALGSALKFCRIAEGGMDVYPRFGPTSEWDTAAGQCLLEAAGGVLLAPDGRPFRYNQREGLLNGDFIAVGDPALPWRDWCARGAA
jgi:3'(2'), 5'-bisphosphate nucleotidase